MAKYKVEYINDLSDKDGFRQVVELRKIDAKRQDFIVCKSFFAENHPNNSKSITLDRQCTVWLYALINTQTEQNLLILGDMILHLIATEAPVASKGIDFEAMQTLILTPEKEQEIERIYTYAKENTLENLKQLQTHGLFKASENLDEKKDFSKTNTCVNSI